jgi:uncharacterized protein YbjQ (UPF0145 family)
MIPQNMITTRFELDGYRVVRSLGVVRGIIVRSRSILGTIGASLQTLVGGNITLLTNLCEKAREDSFDLMLQHARVLGANAVVGVRYDANEIMQGHRSPMLRHSSGGRSQTRMKSFSARSEL